MKIAVLVGGGVCPGINAVISAIVAEGHSNDLEIVGISRGFDGAKRGPINIATFPRLNEGLRQRIATIGGAVLLSSRTSLVGDPQGAHLALRTLRQHGVDALIGIGGDDTLSSLATLSAADREHPFPVIHVPKSIDGDLPVPTFGFHTAADECANQAVVAALDVQSMGGGCGLVGMMGRHTGHLAVETARYFARLAGSLGVQHRSSHPWVLIPELFHRELDLEALLKILVEAIKRDRNAGKMAGVILIAEGIFDILSAEGKEQIAKRISHDDHGHVKLAEIPFFPIVAAMLREKLKARGAEVRIRLHEPGFSIRALPPRKGDIVLCQQLGVYAVHALLRGKSSMTVYERAGRMGLYPFSRALNTNGRVATRRVDCRANQDVLGPTRTIIDGVLARER